MIKIKKKTVALILAVAVCLISGSVLPTLSWLTAKSDTVVNTFAGGAISLILDEAKVDGNGKTTEGERVTENSYRIIPGTVLDKDPTVTVLSGSDKCYVFLYVENSLPEEYFSLDYSNQWVKAAVSEGGVLYIYQTAVDARDGDVVLPAIFTQVSVSEELTEETISSLGEMTLKVQAYAVQSDGIAYAEALSMAKDWFEAEFGLSGFTDADAGTDFDTGTADDGAGETSGGAVGDESEETP